jgi:hypothetical protein
MAGWTKRNSVVKSRPRFLGDDGMNLSAQVLANAASEMSLLLTSVFSFLETIFAQMNGNLLLSFPA